MRGQPSVASPASLSPFPLTVHTTGGGQMGEEAAISSDIILEREGRSGVR